MSDSVRPHRWQPTRVPRPWDSPGKNTGVGCHFLLQCMKVKSEREVAQSCPTLLPEGTHNLALHMCVCDCTCVCRYICFRNSKCLQNLHSDLVIPQDPELQVISQSSLIIAFPEGHRISNLFPRMLLPELALWSSSGRVVLHPQCSKHSGKSCTILLVV